MAFAVEQGFDFTVEEIKEAASSLSDNELSAIAVGLSHSGDCFMHMLHGRF